MRLKDGFQPDGTRTNRPYLLLTFTLEDLMGRLDSLECAAVSEETLLALTGEKTASLVPPPLTGPPVVPPRGVDLVRTCALSSKLETKCKLFVNLLCQN